MSDAADPVAYVVAVLTLYVDLPDTPLRASVSDQWLARRLYDDGVPLPTVETALLLGSLRRLIRPAGTPRLSPIRSLAYFRPVIEELQAHPVPDGYLDYLRLKLRHAATALSADAQKSTFSDERPWRPGPPSRRMKRTRESATLLMASGRNEGRYCGGSCRPLMNVAWTSGVGSRTVVAATGG